MARFGGGFRTSVTTTGAACLEIITDAQEPFLLTEMRITVPTISTFGLGFPAVAGITPTSPVLLLPEHFRPTPPAAGTTVATAWGTGPTIPAYFFRREATTTEAIVWDFGRGLLIPAGVTLVVWNLATNAVADINIAGEWEQQRAGG